MSTRRLCSHVVKSSNSTFFRRKYFTNARVALTTRKDPVTLVPSLQIVGRERVTSVQVHQTVNYSQALGSLTKDQAHDLVFRLNDDERHLLLKTLEQYNVKLEKDGLESAATPPPKTNELLRLCLINSLPFVGFGFLDNFTMIIAGDYIEHSLGLIMTISTMAAAALGNTISDVLGIGSAVYVERFVEVIGVRPPDLTPVQLEMKSARRASNFGRVLGITVGCLLGMLPLIFMKTEKDKDDKKKDKKDTETPTAAAVVVAK